jgi:DNA invertase Pin-like site-specific DNA recombinase
MKKAFAYLRVSGKDQLNGDGFERQLSTIQKYAKDNGFKVVETFEERGVSGTTEGFDRPAWVAMIAKLMSNGNETVLVERLDRIGRDLMVQEHIIADLRKRGITLISTHEPDLCVDDPTRKLLRQIMGAIAEYDKSMVVLKLRGARQRQKARGERCEGAKPFGFRPGESGILDRIKRARSAGASMAAIAKELNESGASKPRHGAQWHASTIRSVLKTNGMN